MRITGVETLCLSRLHEPEQRWFTASYHTIKADCAIVVMTTDEGYIGIGEACAYGVPTRMREVVAWLAQELIGTDPRIPNALCHPNGRSFTYDCAVAGIDCALWDLRGKIAQKRVSELLSDHPLERVRLYASGGCRYDWRKQPEQLIDEVLSYVDAGYTACKVRIGTEWAWDGVTVERFLGLIRELARAVDGRIELMLDGNQRLREDEALVIAKEIDRLGFVWFEEPIPQHNIEGYVRLNAAVGIPITGGEQFTTLEQFKPYLERKAYGIVQPDVACCGLSEAMKIAHMAARYEIDVCPHNWHNGLMTMANAHFVAALPQPRVLELCMIQGPLQWAILAEKPTINMGWLELPNCFGLGVELAQDLVTRFPYIEGGYALQIER